MTLVLETPSRRCPNRAMNGREVEILEHRGEKRLRRVPGRLVQVYTVVAVPVIPHFSRGFDAYADELFVVPSTV